MTELKKDWLQGEQMEGFKPCPFCGELPFIKIEPKEAFGVWLTKPIPVESVWAWLTCRHFGGEIRYNTNRSVYYTDDRTYPWKRVDVRTVEQASHEALEEVRKRWNTRSEP